MWEQLSGATPCCQIREQNQHELRVQQRSGEVPHWLLDNPVWLYHCARLTCDMFRSSPGGAESTQSSPCCRSSGDSCCSRRTWSSASPLRAPPIKTRDEVKKLLELPSSLKFSIVQSPHRSTVFFGVSDKVLKSNVFSQKYSSINHRHHPLMNSDHVQW